MTTTLTPDLTFLCDTKRHLICAPYSVNNLHSMAATLGIKRCWYHGGDKPHYDIPLSRVDFVRAQCKLVSSRQLLQVIQATQHPADLGCAPDGHEKGSANG